MIKNQTSDMLTRVQNASLKKHATVLVNFNKLNYSILKILFNENFINGYYIFIDNNNKKYIKILLKYYGWWIKNSTLYSLRIIKKSEFFKNSDLVNRSKSKTLLSKTLIISTSAGLLTLKEAMAMKLGGKLICQIN